MHTYIGHVHHLSCVRGGEVGERGQRRHEKKSKGRHEKQKSSPLNVRI